MELRAGVQVDRYTLVEPLGVGGQGAVWKVVDPIDGVVVALKLFDLGRAPASTAERARREAEAVGMAADHPGIVPCRNVFTLPDGWLGLVFELVRGQALSGLLGDPRLGLDHRLAVLGQLASALAHVHGRGIVHRDLKPSNVLLADTFWAAPHTLGNVKLVDFGIAALAGNPRGLTTARSVIGTIPYLAPELIVPGIWAPSPAGFSRDIFAFGVLAWELLVGGHPTGVLDDTDLPSFAVAYRAAHEGRRAWPPAGLSGVGAEVISACLTLDPARRTMTSATLERALRSEPVPRRAAAPVTKPYQVSTGADEAPWSSSPRARAGATLPPTSVQTPSLNAFDSPVTTPMPLPPPSAAPPSSLPWAGRTTPVSLEGAAVRRPPAPPRASTKKRSSFPWLLTGGLGIIGIAAIVDFFITRAEPEAQGSLPAPGLVAPRPPPRSSKPPLGAKTALPRQSPRAPTPCCAGGSCKSGRACAPSPPCATVRILERSWRLRLTGAVKDGIDVGGTHPAAQVCLRRAAPGEEWVCSAVKKMERTKDGDGDNRLHLMTSDLEHGTVEIRLLEGADVLYEGQSTENPDGLSSSSLCSGLRLYVGPREAGNYIAGYLDDDED